MKLSKQESSEHGKRTDKFMLKTTKDQDAVFLAWAVWTRRAYNYILTSEFMEIKDKLSQFELERKWITNDKLFKGLDFRLKKLHAEGLTAKVAATIKRPEAASMFIVGRTRVANIEKDEKGKYILSVLHPFAPNERLEIKMVQEDRKGQSIAARAEPFLNRDFPFEIHRNRRKHAWILHATGDYEVGKIIPFTRVMGIDLGVRNIVYAVVREEAHAVWSKHWQRNYFDQMGKWKRDYGMHAIADELVSKAREFNAIILLEDLDVFEMKLNRGKESEFDVRVHRALNGVAMRKIQDVIARTARRPFYVEGRLQPQVEVKFVDARYTTRTCPRCGWVEEKREKGEVESGDTKNIFQITFNCASCKYKNNYDFIAAWNLARKALVAAQTHAFPA